MRLMKLGAALFAITALGAILASSAFATASTTAAKWYTGTTETGVTELTGEQSVTAEQIGTGTFTTHISGEEIVVHATGVNCVNCKISNATKGGGGTGELEFTGVTVEKPVGCSTSATIKTKPLTVEADWMEGEAAMVKFVPTAGEEAGFAQFELSGASCPLATKVIPKGYVFGKAENKTGVMRTSQVVNFSKAIQNAAEATGGPHFHVGAEEATLTATGKFTAGGLFYGEK